jgi:predicted DNA-binding protein (UPF0278 family)
MDILADENAETEWIRALRDDGHDVLRVVETNGLCIGAPDIDVLAVATRVDRVVLTADQSDFGNPPMDDHVGIVIVSEPGLTGAEVRQGVRRIERNYPDLSGYVAYVNDWL